MKNFLSFLSYHNAVPAALVVLTLGAGGVFAASTGMLPLPDMTLSEAVPAQPAFEPVEVDVSALLSVDADTFDFRPTVTSVTETDSVYVVSYSVATLAPENGAWGPYEKTGEFSVGADALGEGGLNAYVVAKLRDIEARERTYLASAQAAERELESARNTRPTNAFAGLVGLALDQIFVPVVEKPAPVLVPQPVPPVLPAAAATTSENATPVTTTSTPAEQFAPDDENAAQATSTATSTATVTGPGTATSASTTDAVYDTSPNNVAGSDQGAASSTEQAIISETEKTTDTATATPAN